jgi:glycosyltransferase involved in cell wall biosynthesis
LKILHIGKYFPPYAGGMETYLRDLMAAQSRQGLKPAALVHQSSLSLSSTTENYAAGEEELPITRAAVWARAIFTPISPTFPWRLHKLIKEEQPDILHLHMPNVSAFWALFLPSARRIPWVVHWHADVLASQHSLGLRLFYTLYRPFERAVLRHSNCIIATSPPYLESSEPLSAFREKCAVVPLGLDPSNLARPGQCAERENSSNLRVLAIGRLTYYKGFEYLIRAVAGLEGVELHLVGTGELDEKLKALTRQLQAEEKITFHGNLPDTALAAQYEACDCLCLPSVERTEAFGMVLLEAMSHSKATIVSKVGGSGMTWVVENGVTGLHTPPQNAGALANSIRDLRDNRDNIAILGNKARERFCRLFQVNRSEESIRLLYQEIHSNGANNHPA